MDDLSTYQWLVLVLLSIIAVCAIMVVTVLFGLVDLLAENTRRLESALGRKAEESESLLREIEANTRQSH